MYKTVRHGENSLQYTILPQTEEVLTNSGLKGRGRDFSPSIHVRRRKRSTAKYVLIIVFGLMIAVMLAAIPICLMNGALYMRRHHGNHEPETPAPLTPTGRELVKSRKKELKMSPEMIFNLKVMRLTSSTTEQTPSTTVAPTTQEVTGDAATPPWTMPALRSWKNLASSTSTPSVGLDNNDNNVFLGTPSGSIRLLDQYMSLKPWEQEVINRQVSTSQPFRRKALPMVIIPHESSTTVATTSTAAVSRTTTTTTATPATPTTTATSTATSMPSASSERSSFADLKESLLSVDDDDDFKESLEVDEVFSLPPLKPDWSDDEVTVSQATEPWYGVRWPYIQWTGYSRQDAFVVAVLVSTIMSTVIGLVMLAVCLQGIRRVRGDQRIITDSQLSLSVEQGEEVNTNLLEDNTEDGEE